MMLIPEELKGQLTTNQLKIILALGNNQKGLLSSELAHQTKVSNKSATFTQVAKELLAKYNLKIKIERSEEFPAQSLWKLDYIDYDVYEDNLHHQDEPFEGSYFDYLQIKQIIAANNYWNVYLIEGALIFHRADCLALCDVHYTNEEESEIKDQVLRYISVDDAGCFDILNPCSNFIKTVYCEQNPNKLSNKLKQELIEE